MWEYKTETFDSILDNKRTLKEKCDFLLEKHGKAGWELVSFQCIGALGSMMVLIFKRPRKQAVPVSSDNGNV